MKTSRLVGLFAATLLSVASSAQAQLITETISDWSGSVFTFSANRIRAQTFSGLINIETMTYRFASASNSAAALLISARFVEWNDTSNASTAVGAVVQAVPSFQIPASNTWSFDSERDVYYFDYTINLSQATDPLKTYAMVLSSTVNSSIGLSFTNDDTFQYGTNVRQTNALGTLSDLGSDWGFSYLEVTPQPIIPESSTVAGVLGGVLVAGLAGFRLRQRRQLIAA